MLCNIFSVTVLMTFFCAVYSEEAFLNETIHIRVKRGKYYSYPPRFYKPPPNTYPTKGAFSLTPPPGYMMDEDDPYPGRPHYPKPKVSKRPEAVKNDGLRDEDINNLVKYLSKQDLDKIIEIASEKERIRGNSIERRPYKRDESRVIKDTVQEYSNPGFTYNGPYRIQDSDNKTGHWIAQELDSAPVNHKPQNDVYGPYKTHNLEQLGHFNPPENSGSYAPNDQLNYVEDATQSKVVYFNHDKGNFHTEESMQNKQISYLNAYIHHEINDLPNQAFSENGPREEILPRPLNLREDFDISYTNNVPTVVKPNYKVENFGDLPLMSNAHKLDTVSSYKVPHYTVTSNGKHNQPSPSLQPSSSSAAVPLEPAPPVSAAKEQSDAHLKAVKIWTHQSQGTAYYLHDDGTLSLEKPGRPKTN